MGRLPGTRKRVIAKAEPTGKGANPRYVAPVSRKTLNTCMTDGNTKIPSTHEMNTYHGKEMYTAQIQGKNLVNKMIYSLVLSKGVYHATGSH